MRGIISDLIEFFLFISAAFIFTITPASLSLALGKNLGKLVYRLKIKKDRYELALSNIKKRLDLTDKEAKEVLKKMYINLGMSLAEFFRIPFLNKDYLKKNIIVEGGDDLSCAIKNHKKAILITAHFGNWELSQIIFSLLGYKMVAVAYPQHNFLTNFVINYYRKKKGTKIIPRNSSYKNLNEALEGRDTLGIVADQDVGKTGIPIKFLNTVAYATKAPAILALRKKLPLFVSLLIRLDTKHLLKIIKVEIEKAGPKEDIFLLTQAWNDIISDYIRLYPEQWFWLHRRFNE